MPDKKRLDIEIDASKFEDLKEFIDQTKKCRKSSKRFYGEVIVNMAYNWMQKRIQDKEMKAKEFKEIENKIKDVIE